VKDWGLKLISVLIASLLAVLVSSERNSSVVTLVVPVEVQNLPANRIILLPENTETQVTLRGPSFILARAYSQSRNFRVFLPDEVEDRFRAVFRGEDLELPSSVQIVRIEPPEIEFIFDEVIETELKVEVPRIGEVPGGLRLEKMEVLPPHVKVSGARTELRGLKALQTQAVNLNDVSGETEVELKLLLPGKYTRSALSAVRARLTVIPETLVERPTAPPAPATPAQAFIRSNRKQPKGKKG